MPSEGIRLAQPEDEAQILALAQDFATSFVVEPDAFHRTFAILLDKPDACLLVATVLEKPDELRGYLLGFVHPTFYANGAVAWVEEVAVRQEERRSGVGTALMDQFEDWARAREARLVALATRRAADFYRALGYEESATYFRKLL